MRPKEELEYLRTQVAVMEERLRDTESEWHKEVKELKKSKEEHLAVIQKLREELATSTRGVERTKAELAGAYAQLETAQDELTRTKSTLERVQRELNSMRGARQDAITLSQYNQRLTRPITADEVRKAYPGCEVIATPAFFRLEGEHDIIWLLPRGDLERRSNGFLPNLLNSPRYDLAKDELLSRQLPDSIKSTVNIVFVRRRQETISEKIYTVCEPNAASEIVVTFWAEATESFQKWQAQYQEENVVTADITDHPNWRLIYLVLPFPCVDTSLQLVADNLDDNSTADDLKLMQEKQAQTQRETYQRAYRSHFFGNQRSLADEAESN